MTSKVKKGLNFSKYLVDYASRLIFYPFMSVEQVFSDIYLKNIWNNKGTVSGDSSTIESTEILREELSELIKKYNIKSVLDIPCGDFNWMSRMDFSDIDYTGADIVQDLIDNNKKKYSEEKFIKLDICQDSLPECDLIFCRDCLVHLSNKNIFKAMVNIRKSGSKYLLLTTFSDKNRNSNIVTGAWRALNFQKSPFNFPEPLEIINEGFALRAGRYPDKSMELWKIKNL